MTIFQRNDESVLVSQLFNDEIVMAEINRRNEIDGDFKSIFSSKIYDQESIAKELKTRKLQRKRARIVLQTNQYSLLRMQLPDVPEFEMESALKWNLKSAVNYDIDEAVIDYFRIIDSKESYVGVVNKNEIKKLHEMFFKFGLVLEKITIPEIAARGLFEDSIDDVCVVLFKRDGCQLFAFKKGLLNFSRSFNPGMNFYQNLLVDDDVIIEIQRSLDYCERQLGIIPPSKMLLIGGVSDDVNVLKLFKDSFTQNIEVRQDCYVGFESVSLIMKGAAVDFNARY